MIIKVTQGDIDNGLVGDRGLCPIALAMKRKRLKIPQMDGKFAFFLILVQSYVKPLNYQNVPKDLFPILTMVAVWFHLNLK